MLSYTFYKDNDQHFLKGCMKKTLNIELAFTCFAKALGVGINCKFSS